MATWPLKLCVSGIVSVHLCFGGDVSSLGLLTDLSLVVERSPLAMLRLDTRNTLE